MKVLLIAPPLDSLRYTTFETNYNKEVGQRPPLGLLYIASYLKSSSSHEVTILDCGIEPLSYDGLKKRIEEINPDLVGIQALTFTLIDVLKTAQIVKEYRKNIPVVLGGPHPSIYPEESLAHKNVDFIVRKEGELSFKKLIDNLGDEAALSEIAGVGFKRGNNTVLTGEPEVIFDLDKLPLPDRALLPYHKYRSVFSLRAPSTIMMTSRGCPYNCVFCERMGKEYRARSPQSVTEEIEHCLSLGIRDISFCDDTFTVDKKRVLGICELIRKKRLKFNWDIKTRVDVVDYELLKAMKESGCDRINFGVESANLETLKRLNKGITTDQVETAFRHAKKLRIKALAFLMVGSPFETRKDIEETFRFVKRLRADYIQLSITVPCPGTKLYKNLLEEGLIKFDTWKDFALKPDSNFTLPLASDVFSQKELRTLVSRMYKRYYFSVDFILKELFSLRSAAMLVVKIRTAFCLFMQRIK